MRGTIALRSQRLVLAAPRARGFPRPVLRITPSRISSSNSSVCLLCRYNHTSTTPSILRQLPLQQRRTASGASRDDSTPITPDVTNHYTIFPSTLPKGPPPQSPFEIDTSSLRREFLRLQNGVHPDKVPQGPEKQRAEALSSRINDAYRTLVDPLSRAQYLLAEFHGIDVLAEDGGNSKAAMDSETLMEIMDVQEAVEELTNAPTAEAESEIARLRKENAERIEDSVRKLGEAFDNADMETAQMETVRLRFWYSLRDGLREWEPGHAEIRIIH
ncbi:hypothetical protein BGW36DRAFT_375400 [Talaromyces proteolyticus]|uniref:J domain-containing protein n=1 Tax=Talaromyces proteolyticus TaxID=1131652 RepID=A0AAD4KVY8_9EURO|nr:uncharacterized protein BGW36DRAFT_375400 [Talaromyces proteolyticus]KAH8701019.1 hypothetical protein BGW36DRAFT_375400 [Talaromyces proteolyticus]